MKTVTSPLYHKHMVNLLQMKPVPVWSGWYRDDSTGSSSGKVWFGSILAQFS